jgi:hypothetical protein
MARKRHKPEEIIAKLRQVEVLTSQGQSMADAIRLIGGSRPAWWCRSCGEVACRSDRDESGVGRPAIHGGWPSRDLR